MLALLLSVVVQAAPAPAPSPSPRLVYEDKCLFCHSEEVTEEKHFTVGQWKRIVAKMRAKAPLLITRHDAEVVTQYIVKTLKLVPSALKSGSKPVPAPVEAGAPAPGPASELHEMPETLDEPPPMPPEEQAMADAEDEEGAALMQRRCAKCHTLQRAFTKLDSYERSLFTLKRMRLKTGSGISKKDEERIVEFLKAQFGVTP